MGSLTVGVMQLRAAADDLKALNARVTDLAEKLATRGADVILVPEVSSIAGRGRHAISEQPFCEPSAIADLARKFHVAVVASLVECKKDGRYFTTAIIVDRNGTPIAEYQKTHLEQEGSTKSDFSPGSSFTVAKLEGWNIGLLFGNELLYPEVSRSLSVTGAEILLAPAACGPMNIWKQMLATRAFENGSYLALANLAGSLGGSEFAGGSACVDPLGIELQCMDRHSEGCFVATASMDQVHAARNKRFMLRDRRPDAYGRLITPLAS